MGVASRGGEHPPGATPALDAQAERGAPAPPGGGRVVVLAGGTGGAKLARGMLDVVGAKRLTVIANTGDDIEMYGAHVSPDVDLVSFWLADLIDERGWGLARDTFAVMEGLRSLGVDVWFNLGDRDLAWCIERSKMLAEGLRPTQAIARLCERIGVSAQVLPMCDTPIRTLVNSEPLQEFMIRRKAEGPVRQVRFEIDRPPAVSPEVRDALDSAEAVIVGPSNPVISIWPILVALREQLAALEVPIVCVSPVVGGRILKGPTAACLQAYGQPLSAAGVIAFYKSVAPELIGGIVCDEDYEGDLPCLRTQMLMADAGGRAQLAQSALSFAQSLRRSL